MIARRLSCRLSGPMSSLERARPLLHEGRFARPVRGKREWDENENEAESWHVDRTALRRPPQAFEKRSRRVRRKTPFSPGSMGSIAKRLLNGRRVRFLPLPEDRWVRILPMTVGKGLHAAGFWGRRVARERFAEVNPFRLAAEAHPNDSEMRAETMIVVAGVELARGRDGFVLLALTTSHPVQVIKLPPKIFSTPPVPPETTYPLASSRWMRPVHVRVRRAAG
jgi:CDP-diacylglycerol pyrophosphatase